MLPWTVSRRGFFVIQKEPGLSGNENMSDFPSPLILSNQTRIAEALAHTFSRLPEQYNAYRAYTEGFRNHPERLPSFIAYALYHFCLLGGFLRASLKNKGKSLFEFGIPLPESALLSSIESYQSRDQVELAFVATAPREIESLCGAIVQQELIPLICNYYLHNPELIDDRNLDLAGQTERQLEDLIDSALMESGKATLCHVRLQNLHTYFEVSREHLTSEMIRELTSILERNLKQSDVIYSLSPFSYLILTAGVEKEKILERLSRLYFAVRNMPIDYKVYATTLTGPRDFQSLVEELHL